LGKTESKRKREGERKGEEREGRGKREGRRVEGGEERRRERREGERLNERKIFCIKLMGIDAYTRIYKLLKVILRQ